jgi:hypothetical protein
MELLVDPTGCNQLHDGGWAKSQTRSNVRTDWLIGDCGGSGKTRNYRRNSTGPPPHAGFFVRRCAGCARFFQLLKKPAADHEKRSRQ